jgi:hydroxymethylglutaryl-CoA lyase
MLLIMRVAADLMELFRDLGCPMAKDDLTGNMPTEKLLSYFTANKENTNLNPLSFESAYNEASKLFGEFH